MKMDVCTRCHKVLTSRDRWRHAISGKLVARAFEDKQWKRTIDWCHDCSTLFGAWLEAGR